MRKTRVLVVDWHLFGYGAPAVSEGPRPFHARVQCQWRVVLGRRQDLDLTLQARAGLVALWTKAPRPREEHLGPSFRSPATSLQDDGDLTTTPPPPARHTGNHSRGS